MRSIALQLGLFGATAFAQSFPWLSPVYENFFEFPLPIPPIKQSLKTVNGVDYYEVDIRPVDIQIYPNLKATRHVGYDGMVPGPTFMMRKGKEAVVRFINHADRANSVHLHGSYSRAPFDGWAEDTTEIGQYKDYYYPNGQNARTLWYHDHAIDHTAENAYFGQAGFYILHDTEEEGFNLPSGKYDIPLALASKRYNADGSLWSPDVNAETVSVFGDVIHVNGQPWPYLAVEPRKYRFRFLDTSVSRSFQMYLEADTSVGNRIQFNVIGSDTGLLSKPVPTTQLDISMAERWEVVIDFANFAGQNLTLRNQRKVAADDDFNSTDKVMRFVVGASSSVTSQTGNGNLPASLRTVKFPPLKTIVDHHFKFERSNGKFQVNGVSWSDGPEARVLAKPQRGSVEVWELENSSGGWSHPIHIHLIDFQVLKRTGGERTSVLPYEAAGLKDVVWLNKGETVTVIARYSPWDGLYMFHCHNLIHEDHEMMAAFNVSVLADLGYPETTRFIDPMESRYRAVSFTESDFQAHTGPFSGASIDTKVNFFIGLDAYKHADDVETALEAYWVTHSSTPAAATGSSTTTTTTTSSGAAATTTSGAASSTTSGPAASSTTSPGSGASSSTAPASTIKTSTTKTSTTKTTTTKATTTSKK